jgi:hypothetical protein
MHAQTPEPPLPRPGAVVVSQLMGEAKVLVGDEAKPLKAEDRVRVGVTLTTGRRSLLTLELSNGATLQLGAEAELELEEFGQQPFSNSIKPKEEKTEPSISRTRLRLVRGDLVADVKPLNRRRGSSFTVTMPAGTLRMFEGTLRAMTQMSELGLGVCTLELQSGAGEFEPLGGTSAPLAAGKKYAFALETDRATGTLRLGEMPKAEPAKTK